MSISSHMQDLFICDLKKDLCQECFCHHHLKQGQINKHLNILSISTIRLKSSAQKGVNWTFLVCKHISPLQISKEVQLPPFRTLKTAMTRTENLHNHTQTRLLECNLKVQTDQLEFLFLLSHFRFTVFCRGRGTPRRKCFL